MSDYLVSLASRSINQNRGSRFLAGELRPRLASRFEPQRAGAVAWPEPLPSFEEATGSEAVGPDLPVTMPMASLGQPGRTHQRTATHHPVSAADLASAGQKPVPLAVEATMPGAHSTDILRPGLSDQHRSKIQDVPRFEEGGVLSSEESLHFSLLPESESVSEVTTTSATLPESPTEHRLDHLQSTGGLTQAVEQPDRHIATVPSQATVVEHLLSQVHALDQQEPLAASPAILEHEQLIKRRQSDRMDNAPQPQRQPTSSFSAPHDVSVTNAAARVESVLATAGTPSDRPAPEQSRQVLQNTLDRLNEPGAEAEPRAVPTVNVTIGRVEVRAVPASTPPALKPRPTPAMTLEEYLRRRAAGGGS